MTGEKLLTKDWQDTIERLGGREALIAGAKTTKAFVRARIFEDAIVMLRLILAYCLGDGGLRSTVAWAAAMGLVDVANTALLYRLRQSEKWLILLIEQLLIKATPPAFSGRPIRIVDATNVLKAGVASRAKNRLWRIHCAFDLPAERFGHFELTDEHGGERFDRVPVVKGEIRLGDRAYMQPDRLAAVIEAGGDVLVRAGWRSAHWLDENGKPFDILSEFQQAESGSIDKKVLVRRKSGEPLGLRLIAKRKPQAAAEAARRAARKSASKQGHRVSEGTLAAADWLILVTSLRQESASAEDILALYRLRWRIELGFKRLKSLIGLKRPPGVDPRSAKPYVLAHLLLILLLEPSIDAFEDSPPLAQAA